MRIVKVLSVGAVLFLAASVLWSGEPSGKKVVVELVSGDRVEASLLKRDKNRIYLYVGGDIISFDWKKVKALQDSEKGSVDVENVKEYRLYRTADLPVKSVQALAEEFGQAVVVVKTPSGLGTGWFCNREGYLVTNNHVVAGERSISVTMFHKEKKGFGKKTFKKVRIVALNDDIDLALLKIEEPIEIDYPQLYIGDSTQVKVGDRCFAIGNPLGLERTTSQGDISKAARNYAGRLYIQMTAPIAPGNSGGPLFNDRGQVIGVTNMGYLFMDGLGFAIPSKYIKEFLDNAAAFAYDEDNPNSGTQYMEAPVTAIDGSIVFNECEFLRAGRGISCLALCDINGDSIREIIFANNSKAEIGIVRLRKRGEEEKRTDDFEDINQLPESERFKIVTVPVQSSISSLAVSDITGDSRPDIVFYGDIDSLAVLEQKKDGTFKPARTIDDIKAAARKRAVQVSDMDGDGANDICVLGTDVCTVFFSGKDRKEYPLNRRCKSNLNRMELMDLNSDGRTDIALFVKDQHYAAYVRLQDSKRNFTEEFPLESYVSGPVRPYTRKGNRGFLTLDTGLNRVREMFIRKEAVGSASEDAFPHELITVPVDPSSGVPSETETGDIDGDGKLDILTVNTKDNTFVVFSPRKNVFEETHSPSPKAVSRFKLYTGTPGKPVLFSFSREDKIFGVSRIEKGKVSFPRPMNTDGEVQFLMVTPVQEGRESLVWVEKKNRKYRVHSVPADSLVQKAYDGNKGSIDLEKVTFRFYRGDKANSLWLEKKPVRITFADLNGDRKKDMVVYWAYSGKQSLYLGRGQENYLEILHDRKVLKEQKDQPLIVEDIDGDGEKDVLLVQPGFMRVLRVDAKNKLYVEKQYNWKFDTVRHLGLYAAKGKIPQFIAVSGRQAKIIELDPDRGEFVSRGTLDLAGLDIGRLKVGDIDGNGKPDLLGLGKGQIYLFFSRPQRMRADADSVFSAKLDHFTYWNLFAADLDKDGSDEVFLFDRKKAMFEIYRPDRSGQLKVLLRRRLFEKTIFQRGERGSFEFPRDICVGDVDGNGTRDFVCILQDRVAVYLQGK